ncbi:MAG: hypothetical protein ACKOPQ_12970 [Novosphingobium sp.]
MLTLALIANALTMAAPTPLTSADNPGQPASVAVEVQVDKSGKPLSCAKTVLSGDDGAGEATCAALMRKTWRPARLRNGTGVTAVYRDILRWNGSQERAVTSSPRTDLTLKVASLPDGRKGPVELTTVLLINGAGAIEQCNGDAFAEKAYADAACEALLGQKFRERAAPNGKPTNYVTTANVRFTVEGAG